MKRGLAVLSVVFLAVGFGAAHTEAGVLTLTDAQIKLTQGAGPDKWDPTNNIGGLSVPTHIPGTDLFSITFDPLASSPLPDPAVASWELDLGSNLAASSTDMFGLILTNSNGNIWEFQMSVLTVGGGSSATPWTAMSPLNPATFLVSLGGGTTAIDTVTVAVRGSIPFDDGDISANFNVAPIPEPGTLALLGIGLLGTVVVARKRRRT